MLSKYKVCICAEWYKGCQIMTDVIQCFLVYTQVSF